MEQLDEMRNRAEHARLARDRIDDARDDVERSSAYIMAALFGEHSSYDVPVLLKTIDEVLRVLTEWENHYNMTGVEDVVVFTMAWSIRGAMKRAMNEH